MDAENSRIHEGSDGYTQADGDDDDGADGRQALDPLAVTGKAIHERTRLHHENADGDQDRSQPDAERKQKQKPEGYAMQGNRQQQDHQRPVTWNDASGNPEGQEASQGHLVRNLVAVGMAMPVVVVIFFMCVAVVPVVVMMRVTVVVVPVVVVILGVRVAAKPLQMTDEEPYPEGHDQNS